MIRQRKISFFHPFLKKTQNGMVFFKFFCPPPYIVFFVKSIFKIGSHTSIGFGAHVQGKKAVRIAFSEAWERYWVQEQGVWLPIEVKKNFSSNGFAAGEDPVRVFRRALGEWIERACFLSAWQQQSGFNQYRGESIWSFFLKKALATRGFSCQFFQLTPPFGKAVLGVFALHPKRGLLVDTVWVEERVLEGERKLFCSLLKMEFFSRRWCVQKPVYQKGPLSHLSFYACSQAKEALRFLKKSNRKSNQIFKNPPKLSELQFQLIYPGTTLPFVGVCYHPKGPFLKWGLQSIEGKNPYPHPLA